MSEEYKISVPLISNQELEKLKYNISTYYSDIVEKISETIAKDKDIIVLQQVIKYQDKKIKQLSMYITADIYSETRKMYNKINR